MKIRWFLQLIQKRLGKNSGRIFAEGLVAGTHFERK